MRKRYLDTLGKEAAVRKVLERIRPMEAEERIGVPFCRGRITSRPVRARLSNPPFVCAAMDGYAVAVRVDPRCGPHESYNPFRGIGRVCGEYGRSGPGRMNAVIMAEEVEERDPSHSHQEARLPMAAREADRGGHYRRGHPIPCQLHPGHPRPRLAPCRGHAGSGGVRKRPRLLITPTGAGAYRHLRAAPGRGDREQTRRFQLLYPRRSR